MRSFSNEEQGYIIKIVSECKSMDINAIRIENLIVSVLGRYVLVGSDCTISLKPGESNSSDNKIPHEKAIKEAYIPFVNFINLLKYLEDNSLITIFEYSESKDIDLEKRNDDIVEKVKTENCNGDCWFDILGNSYKDFLNTNYSNLVYPSQELFDLVTNNYKTQERLQFEAQISLMEKQHACAMGKANEQITKTISSLRISWSAFVASLVFGIFTICHDTRIDKQQFEQIMEKQIILPAMIKAEITNDTINARVTEKIKHMSTNEKTTKTIK